MINLKTHNERFAFCCLTFLIVMQQCLSAQTVSSSSLQSVVCRIVNDVQGAKNLGSGTLIDKTSDGREGLVLTCAHLFREGMGEVVVTFGSGRAHRARLIDVDHQADLAALAIANPVGHSAVVALDSKPSGRLHACGFGPRGVYRCAVGSRIGEAASQGQLSLLIDDPVRSGDSGGGVFDQQGRLVAVIWGESQGVTYASYGEPLRQFLGRVLGRRTSVVYSCPSGVCPKRPHRPSQPRSPLRPRQEHSIVVDARWSAFQKQLEELRVQKQDRGDYVTRNELPNHADFVHRDELRSLADESTSRHASLLERLQDLSGRSSGKAAGTAAVSLLGLSGPAGWAAIAATSLGGWLIGRGISRRLGGAGGRRRRRFR